MRDLHVVPPSHKSVRRPGPPSRDRTPDLTRLHQLAEEAVNALVDVPRGHQADVAAVAPAAPAAPMRAAAMQVGASVRHLLPRAVGASAPQVATAPPLRPLDAYFVAGLQPTYEAPGLAAMRPRPEGMAQAHLGRTGSMNRVQGSASAGGPDAGLRLALGALAEAQEQLATPLPSTGVAAAQAELETHLLALTVVDLIRSERPSTTLDPLALTLTLRLLRTEPTLALLAPAFGVATEIGDGPTLAALLKHAGEQPQHYPADAMCRLITLGLTTAAMSGRGDTYAQILQAGVHLRLDLQQRIGAPLRLNVYELSDRLASELMRTAAARQPRSTRHAAARRLVVRCHRLRGPG